MTATNTSEARRARARKALMMSCASAALAAAALAAAALIPQSAHAQAFQGNITGTTGSVVRSAPNPGTETLTIGSNTATINWSPNQQDRSGPIDFLPNGNTATFTSAAGVSDYTVLNRIIPEGGEAIAINGHVISTLQGTSATGGHVWFYSPGGIVVGATAVFDVGGLLLTTNDVTSFGTTSNGFSASFAGQADSASKILVEKGAQINALQQNSYVALVSPRIEQGGTVRVNGSAAYVAGEQLSMTMNQGLFDIQVDVGTRDPNGVVHSGETSGPASTGAADQQRIYMVAVPKNQAITMLLGGKVGFDDAVGANVENGQIVLTSGWTPKETSGSLSLAPSGSGSAGIDFGPGTYSSTVNARATSEISAFADTGDIAFGGDLALKSVSGNGSAGDITLDADKYAVTIAGKALLDASASGGSESASGGEVTIGAHDGGSVSAGALKILSTGTGLNTAPGGSTTGGDGYGGFVVLTADSGGQINVLGDLSIDASGRGGAALLPAANGGYGSGGFIYVTADGGAVDVKGAATLLADGFGGSYSGQAVATSASGGDGEGGTASLQAFDSGSVSVGGTTTISADGTGGNGVSGGFGYGGGSFSSGNEGNSGVGAGIAADLGSTVSLHDVTMRARGLGGAGLADASGVGGNGGDGFGGSASIESSFFGEGSSDETSAPTLTLGAVSTNVNGQGGTGAAGTSGGNGGGGTGGASSVALDTGVTSGAISSLAVGIGGDGGIASNGRGGDGGSGSGGSISLLVDSDGSLAGTTYEALTNGLGGAGGKGSLGRGNGGAGQSGFDDASVDGTASFGGSTDAHTGFIVTSYAQGGTGDQGGSADAGSSSIDVTGSLSVAGQVQASAQAGGGNGDTIGGTANAGSASVDVSGHLTTGILFVGNQATGGAGATGGDAYGGYGTLLVDGGTVQADTAKFTQSAIGGSSASAAGGYASGGLIDIESVEGGSLKTGSLTADASATGGAGSPGGGAGSGDIYLAADDYGSGLPTSMSLGNVILTANGALGSGGAFSESSALGGSIEVSASGGSIAADSLTGQANGTNRGGSVLLDASSGSDGSSPGALQFGTTNATVNGGDWGGNILVLTQSGSTIGLGTANLRANGAFGGAIGLFAGDCFDCGGGGDGEVSLAASALPAGGGIAASDLTLNTTGNIFVGLSGGADVSVSGTLNSTAGQSISLTDDGTGGALRAHEIDLTAVSIDDNATIIADIIRFTSASAMDLGKLSASDTLALTAGGDLTTGDLSAGNGLTLNSGGSIATGDLSAQTVNVKANGDTRVTDVNAAGSASFTADGLAGFDGVVSSPTITVTSGDIDIADGASLGVSGVTSLVTLNAVSRGAPILIGDGATPQEGQYQLNEDGDIRTASLVINAQSVGNAAAPDVKIFDVTVPGSTTSGGGIGKVTLNTGGSVFVNGNVDFTNAAATDSLAINAGHAIEVNTDTGGLAITDSTSKLAGTLLLSADNVWVGSGLLLGQLETDPNFAGRNAALATNSGTANQDGFLRAGTIVGKVADSFLVQNSGTADLFAGVDTGPGGLSINTTGATPATLIVFGRGTTSAGTVITNLDFIGSVNVTGTGGFTTDSSVNGCDIGGSCGTPDLTLAFDMASILGPLDETGSPSDEDKKKDKDKGEESDDGSSADPNLRLINTTPINLDHQIDEPVTSGGDVVVGGPVQPN